MQALPILTDGNWFGATADGQQFLVGTQRTQQIAERLTLIENWTAALKK